MSNREEQSRIVDEYGIKRTFSSFITNSVLCFQTWRWVVGAELNKSVQLNKSVSVLPFGEALHAEAHRG